MRTKSKRDIHIPIESADYLFHTESLCANLKNQHALELKLYCAWIWNYERRLKYVALRRPTENTLTHVVYMSTNISDYEHMD